MQMNGLADYLNNTPSKEYFRCENKVLILICIINIRANVSSGYFPE